MRLFPIITAALVCVALYFVILDRDRLVDFAARFGPAEPAIDAGRRQPGRQRRRRSRSRGRTPR